MRVAETWCPISRNAAASLAWLFDTHSNGRIGSPTVAGSSSLRKSSSSVGSFRVSGRRPPPARRTLRPSADASNSRRPRWIVLRATPVARETAATPPTPAARASTAANKRRPRSSRLGRSRLITKPNRCLVNHASLINIEPQGIPRAKSIQLFRGLALGKENSQKIRLAVMDMWKPFRKSTQAHAPQAAILFDKFHIVKHLSDALDEVRRSEYKRVTGDDRSFIKGQRYVLLSRRENLTDDRRKNLERLLQANARLNIAYLLREQFEQLWDYANADDMRAFFDAWRDQLSDQDLKPYEKFATMIEKHWDGIAATAIRPTTFRLALSKASTTKSAPSNAAPLVCATRNISRSKSRLWACRNSEITPNLPTKIPEEPENYIQFDLSSSRGSARPGSTSGFARKNIVANRANCSAGIGRANK